MYRRVLIPNERNSLISIPPKWYGKRVEVIVSPLIEKGSKGSKREKWAEAATRMAEEYRTNKELTAFSQIDSDDYYEAR